MGFYFSIYFIREKELIHGKNLHEEMLEEFDKTGKIFYTHRPELRYQDKVSIIRSRNGSQNNENEDSAENYCFNNYLFNNTDYHCLRRKNNDYNYLENPFLSEYPFEYDTLTNELYSIDIINKSSSGTEFVKTKIEFKEKSNY